MKSSRASAKAFALRYFNTTPTLRNKTTLRRKAKRITTVVVDTNNLTNGALTFDRAVPISGTISDVIDTAHQALAGHDGVLSDALSVRPSKAPIKHFSGKATGSVRHHGELFISTWVGKPTALAHQADFTDTEQERFLMHARQLAAHGSMVYAVGRATSKQLPASYKEVSVEIVGLLLFHPRLYHGTEEAVALIREADIDIMYVSQDPEHIVLQFATLSLIANQSTVPFVYRPGRAIPKSAVCYAALSDAAKANVVNGLDKDSTLIVNEPLPDFWQGISGFLR